MTRAPKLLIRGEGGYQLIESLVSSVIGGVIMMAMFQSAGATLRAASSNQNQILATNMAQQVIDSARNSSWTHLTHDLLGEAAGGPYTNVSASQVLSLYDYPTASPAFFPRPLLRNQNSASGMTYSSTTQNTKFNGTVTETITDLGINTGDDQIKVSVAVKWQDSFGSHSYTSSTVIDEYGVHAY